MVLIAIAFIILAHYIVSTIFLIFPLIIKKKRKQKLRLFQLALDHKKVLRFSHRGGPHYRVENTIPAFSYSFDKCQNEVVELDVYLTKDKKLVLYHDKELTRLFGKDIKLHEANYETDFGKPLKTVKLHFNYRRFIDTAETMSEIEPGKQMVPLLKDVLARFPNYYFNIDVKDTSFEAVNRTIQVVKEAKAELRVNIGCNEYPQMRHMRRSLKECSFWACDAEVKRLFIAFLLGFLPYIDLHFDSLLPPYVDPEFLKWELDDPYIKNSKFRIFIFRCLTWLAPILYPHLTKRGYFVVPWVVNTREHIENIIKIGSPGIMSDDSELMTEVVRDLGVELDRKAWLK